MHDLEESSESSRYVRLSQIEHIKTRPDTYIGNTRKTKRWHYVVDAESNTMTHRELEISEGAIKCIDEIIVNARDRLVERDMTVPCTKIKVSACKTEGSICIENNGDGIPVLKHDEYDIFIPELIFGNLLTSSNYDDSVRRIAGGRNGLGAKLTNIFSTRMELETVDAKRKLLYSQTFEDNLGKINPPKVVKYSKQPYTKVTFFLDWKRFDMQGLEEDLMSVLKTRTWDIACTVPSFCKKVNVYFQDSLVETNSFQKYMNAFPLLDTSDKGIYEAMNDNWKVGLFVVPHNGFRQVSFVNSIRTHSGGTHITYILDQITKYLVDILKTKHKITRIPPSSIKDHLFLFVDCLVENPSFTSQTKEELTTAIPKSSCILSESFLKKMGRSEIINTVLEIHKFRENSLIKKTDGKKVDRIKGLPKLEDAEFAGTSRSNKCMLILTEGDSAKASAMSGLSVVGRKYFGVFPLKGKLLNVRDCTSASIMKNEEIQNLKKILGLKTGESYKDTSQLRYGRGIVIFTDQDVDGSHIKGLLMNFIHYFWPDLINNDYIKCLTTPIVKASRGTTTLSFYNLTDYTRWKSEEPASRHFHVKYYKGLGTSTSKESKEYFTSFEEKLTHYVSNNSQETANDFNLAFSKSNSNDRKQWILDSLQKTEVLDTSNRVSYADFIHKELVHFSIDDNKRSIPHVIDGLKPSQRKILFGSFLRNLDSGEIKVSQLSGFVSDKACYHHGENSLNNAIVGMASNFMGSNNIEWLVPNGQFGTRMNGGKDAASPRYIWTSINPMVSHIVKKEDDLILLYNEDDGIQVEPSVYLPVIPMILVNGSEGIGTGFSTFVPPHNPVDICQLIKMHLRNENTDDVYRTLLPFYRGFQGRIYREHEKDSEFGIEGKFEMDTKKGVLRIYELPVGTWTYNYKEFLLNLVEKKEIDNFTENNTDTTVYFEVYSKRLDESDVLTKFRLKKSIRISNMHMFTSEFGSTEEPKIKKFSCVREIVEEFIAQRIKGYQSRREFVLTRTENEIQVLQNKIKFINAFMEGRVQIHNASYHDICTDLDNHEFLKIDEKYDYLLNMKIYNLTLEKRKQFAHNLEEKKMFFDLISTKSPEEMWIDELELLKVKLSETNNY